MNHEDEGPTRHWLSKSFSLIEDIVYIGLGALLAGCGVHPAAIDRDGSNVRLWPDPELGGLAATVARR